MIGKKIPISHDTPILKLLKKKKKKLWGQCGTFGTTCILFNIKGSWSVAYKIIHEHLYICMTSQKIFRKENSALLGLESGGTRVSR